MLDAGEKVIILGDLNAKHAAWNCLHTNNQGNNILNLTLNLGATVHGPDSPTHVPDNGATPDILDIAITHNIVISTIAAINDLSSDYLPVEVIIRGNKPLLRKGELGTIQTANQ